MEVALCKTGKPEKKWIFMHLMEKQLTLELSGEGEQWWKGTKGLIMGLIMVKNVISDLNGVSSHLFI